MYGPMAKPFAILLELYGVDQTRNRTFQPKPFKELRAQRMESEGEEGNAGHHGGLPHTGLSRETARLAGVWVWVLWDSFCRGTAQGNSANESSNKKP